MYRRSNATNVTGSESALRFASRWFDTCMRCCSLEKLGRPSSPSATISPSMMQVVIPRNFPMSASSGNETVTSRSFRLCARTRPPSTKRIARTPSHLISNAQFSSSAGSLPATASMGLMESGRASARVDEPCRWIIQSRSLVWKSTKLPLPLFPVQHELDFGVRPLLHVVGAGVPDRHPAAPVLALRDVALEGRILQRMVLGMHGKVVLLRGLRQSLRERPRGKHAVAFEPEVPVEAARVVLLNDESLAGWVPPWPTTHGLGRLLGIALGAVGIELSRIDSPASIRRPWRHQPPPYPESRVVPCNSGYEDWMRLRERRE